MSYISLSIYPPTILYFNPLSLIFFDICFVIVIYIDKMLWWEWWWWCVNKTWIDSESLLCSSVTLFCYESATSGNKNAVCVPLLARRVHILANEFPKFLEQRSSGSAGGSHLLKVKRCRRSGCRDCRWGRIRFLFWLVSHQSIQQETAMD